MLYFILRLFAILLFKILFRIKVKGKENIPESGHFLVASNHISFLDPVAIGAASPRPLNFMARDDLFSNRIFGWLLRNVNVFPVKRENREDISAIREALKRLRKGKGLVIFPEGRRGDSDKLGEGRVGAALLAYKSGALIIPAFIKGSDKALPRDAKFIRLEPISVTFGKSINIGELGLKGDKKQAYREITERVMDAISRLKDEN
ncbi:MAG: 1-acyl-sn-glycerol-3-phosphate acyltransferase [Candidatus Omnitrophica bacterium]|nr:1-acyl-sn-glycerol-3-phosphate acyltransferase [Candidatus Omnitrophota bacterium]